MPRQSLAFQVRGIEPRDPLFRTADDATKQAFWQAAVKWVEQAMDRQLAVGKDRNGHDLHPIAESTRAKGRWRSHTGMGSADAPPLTPAYALSRTRNLFDARAHWREGYILGFWRFDAVTGRHWGQILGYHRAGAGRLPERDVIGLSPASVAAVRAQGETWWANHKAGREHAQRAGQATIKRPPPSGRPVPSRPVPNRVVAGARFDVEHFTFGIGGSKTEVEKAIEKGTFTGFRKPPPFRPGGGTATPLPMPAAGGSPRRVAASPDRAHLSIKPRTKEDVEQELGVKFTPAYIARGATTTVLVDVQKLDVELAKDKGSHVGPKGSGAAKPGSYAGFERFLKQAKIRKTMIEMPRLALDVAGAPSVIDGRHRIAVFRDSGVRFLPVSVPRSEARAFSRRFGPEL